MFSPQAIKQDFSRAAPQYDEAASLQRRVRVRALQLAKRCWDSNANILDLGCGTGALMEDTKGLGWLITGIDVAPGMCRVAQHKCVTVNADAAALPFANVVFDGVFSSLMLQWMVHPRRVFQEMARVIIPGGQCVLATLLPGTLHELENAFSALDDAPHISRFAAKEFLLAAAGEARLQVISGTEKTIVDYHPDVGALMRSLKIIGAGNKLLARRRGLMTPAQMRRLNREYAAQFNRGSGIPATWKVLYLVLEKR